MGADDLLVGSFYRIKEARNTGANQLIFEGVITQIGEDGEPDAVFVDALLRNPPPEAEYKTAVFGFTATKKDYTWTKIDKPADFPEAGGKRKSKKTRKSKKKSRRTRKH